MTDLVCNTHGYMPHQATSPAATGDRGGSFEQHVAASFLAYLLTRGIPPFLRGSPIDDVHLQAGHLGWETDDILLVGAVDGAPRRVAIQVKNTFTFSADNEECQQVFADAWKDFSNSDIFVGQHDGIALVTGSLPVSAQRRLRIMLDAARAALNATDWLHRLSLPGYHERGAAQSLQTLRSLLDRANGSTVADSQLWGFAQAFDFLPLDLLTPSSAHEAAIRSLLAFTASDGATEPADAAAISWTELVALVGGAEPIAASYDFAKLPAGLRARHGKAATTTARTLKSVAEHSEIVERGVRTNIRLGVSLPRTDLAATVQAAWEEHRILCVSGPAGAGKSGLVKMVFDLAKPHGLAVAFRAESFGAPHLNDVFAPHGFRVEGLRALAALHPRKWIWVESVERLLEKSDRHAFMDLLRLVADDPTWRLILTCRDYQVEAVKSAMFGAVGLDFVHIAMPRLNDLELADVARQLPALAAPLAVPRLRELLRNLFFLEKAASLSWSPGTVVPHDERSFREKVWRDAIRRDDEPADGMPQKRGAAFLEIALRRARSLEPFVAGDDLDPAALARLRDDGLTASPRNDDAWVALSHDVLEDWAVLEWLTQQWRRHQATIEMFLRQVGTFPALRRAYRHWLTEWFEAEPAAADAFVLAVLDCPAEEHWRDDTLVSVLLASTAPDFLLRNEPRLAAGGLTLLRQILHLLRIACKGTPPRLQNGAATTVRLLVPEGVAWGTVADLVHRHLTEFTDDDRALLVGFLEDWTLTISEQQPYPPGSASVGRIAHTLLPEDEDYGFRSEDLNQRIAQVMLRVPQTVAAELHARVRASIAHGRWDRWRPGFAGLVLNHFIAHAVARDFPDLVIEALESYVGLNVPRPPRQNTYARGEVADAFGLPPHLEMEDHPASAFRGPFYHLLVFHPKKGIDLILRVMNRSAAAYGDPAVNRGIIEEPVQVSLDLPDGTTVEQWANSRLWLMYRGTSVAPYILASALMALEAWLFELADARPNDVSPLLLDLLRRSNNVAVTSVVSSVTQAFPQISGEAGVALFTCPPFFALDRERMIGDSTNSNKILSERMPPIDEEHALFDRERNDTHERPHRGEHLESLAVRLQLGPQRAAVQQIIDTYKEALPPPEEQDDEIKLWRLMLHRIDLRNFVVTKSLPDGRSLIQSSTPPEDVQQVVDKNRPAMERNQQRVSLWVWSRECWERKNCPGWDPGQWRARLAEAQATEQREKSDGSLDDRLEGSAIPMVAAVCIRDQWDEMSAAERRWSVDTVCHAVKEDADDRNEVHQLFRGTLDIDQPAAAILPFLLRKQLTADKRAGVSECLALALTHANDGMRQATAGAIAQHLWASDPALAWSCVHALAKETVIVKARRKQEHEKPFRDRVPWEGIEQEAAEAIRPGLLNHEAVDRNTLLGTTLTDGSAHKVMPLLLTIVAAAPPSDGLAQEFFAHVARTLAHAWTAEADHGRRSSHSKFDDDEDTLDLEKERVLSRRLAQFLLGLSAEAALQVAQAVLDASMVHPEKGAEFLEGLILAQDYRTPTPTFWALWQGAVDRFIATIVTKTMSKHHSGIRKLLRMFFLGIGWKHDTRDWPALDGQTARLEQLFNGFPGNQIIFEDYLKFLRRIGAKRLLPGALIPLARKLATKPAAEMLSSDAVLCLEEILGRFIYSDPAGLKSSADMRSAVLVLLNACVKMGSSVCYRQRDDFITPTAPGGAIVQA